MVERLFLVVPRGCLRFVIVVFPDHTHLLFLNTVCLLYQPDTTLDTVNEFRCCFFQRKQAEAERLPPTKAALI